MIGDLTKKADYYLTIKLIQLRPGVMTGLPV